MAKKNSRYGTYRLAEEVEVSNDTRQTGLNNNLAIIGGSGSGKTGSICIPMIQNIESSLVVSETKGQLSKRFGKELENKGYNVYCLDFTNPKKSCGYNPLAEIRQFEDGSYLEQDILSLAKTICPARQHDEPIWENSAASMIAFLIAYCLQAEPEEDRNMIKVCELFAEFISPKGDVRFAKWAALHKDTLAAKKFQEINANRTAEKMFASIVGFVSVALEIYRCAESAYIFGAKKEKCFHISQLGKEKTVLFINVSDTDCTHDNVVNVFYAQALKILCKEADDRKDGRLKIPVRIIMDDFGAANKIEGFDKIISVVRSRDIYLSIVLQSLSQLESMYSHKESVTILNNCDRLIYLSGQDQETAQYIANRACKTTEAIMLMPRDKAYLLTNGERARLVTKIKPYSTVADYEPA